MRSLIKVKALLLVMAASLLAGATSPAQAAPLQQDLTILAIGFVDVAGGNDPSCPGCNGEYDEEDEQVAMNDPLPPLEFVVRDKDGAEVARQTTTPLAGLQRTQFVVPDLADENDFYVLELVADPGGWGVLCANESPTRQLPLDAFQLGSTREDFHFWKGCPNGQPTPVPTDGPTAVPTVTPGGPTVTPGGPTVTPPPTVRPTDIAPSGDDDDDDDDDEDDRGDRCEELGSVKGLVFIDDNRDGVLGPMEPGLGGVRVNLHGGGLQIHQASQPTGQFSFDGLGTGEYDVFVDVGPEWDVTTGRTRKAFVGCGKVVMGNDFGLARVGSTAPMPAPDAPKAGAGIRLPSTGIADVPAAPMLGLIALLLGMVAAVGFATERRRVD